MSDGESLRAVRAAATATARAAARVVVPVECPVCGQPDERLCPGCRAVLDGPLRRRDGGAPAIDGAWPVWALGPYEGGLRAVVLAWKTAGRADLGSELREAMVAAGAAWARAGPASLEAPVWVVPAPSSRARRRRGRPPVADLADGLAEGIAHAGRATRVVEVLRRTGGGQAGRGARARGSAARAGTRLAALPPPGTACVLVDDVLTTGATLAASRDVLCSGGARVLGAVVLAAASSAGGASRGLPPASVR
ncbi:phosphoribosyltransferase family protein [Beutenbergia cavernae]|uniref:phosphoribosyltransferase family protein n=1 Tax=Beutenbergia cavernae TaxID=84757 RepID=UPI0006814FC1|nr:phosphoribosyltransferase family protein [Beutenbergia cavernae]